MIVILTQNKIFALLAAEIKILQIKCSLRSHCVNASVQTQFSVLSFAQIFKIFSCLSKIFCAEYSALFLNISSSQLIFRRILCRLVCILSGEVEEVSAPLQEGISSVFRRSSSPQNLGVFSNLRFSKIQNCCIFHIVF